jgi:hypothetical protein
MRRRSTHKHHPPPPRRLRDRWTIQQAMAVGLIAGLAAVLLSNLQARGPAFLYCYVLLLALTAICGLSILLITLFDVRSRGRSRGGKLHAIRAVDVSMGLLLAAGGLYALNLVRPTLGL